MDQSWAVREFEGARLADRRQVKSLMKIAASLAENADVCFSHACGHAGRQAAHRIFEHAGTTVAGLIAGHVQATAARCAEHERVIVAQDTTMFTFPQPQTTGLARLNRREKAVGLIGHGALAMTPAGTPLGMLYLDIWGGEEVPAETIARRKPLEERESYKWVEGLQAVRKALPETEVIVVQDREADVYGLLAEERPPHVHLLVRVAQNRVITYTPAPDDEHPDPRTPERGKLKDALRAGPVLGQHVVTVPRRSARPNEAAVPERQARLTVRVLYARIQAPAGQRRLGEEREVWLIRACEEQPESGVTPIEWMLICTLPVPDLETAKLFITYYSRRWLIERLHFVLKSGLRTEQLQIDDGTSLGHALAVYYVVAWRLMQLTLSAREGPDELPEGILEAEELEVLSALQRKPVTTLREAVHLIGQLGGRSKYVKTPPGLKALWLGWRKLEGMVLGFQLAKSSLGAIL